jgi:ubiquinone biosynthesis protein COQ4
MTHGAMYPTESASDARRTFDSAGFRLQPLKALGAMRKLLQDKEDTTQVFEIMRALSGNSIPNGYSRLLSSPQGGEIAYRRNELADVLSDRAFIESLPEGSVGWTYNRFTLSENISAYGLVEESRKADGAETDLRHPFAWYGRRLRDVHDLWHVLTGYGRDAAGETCLVAFSYPQTRALGFGFIAVAGAIKLKAEFSDQPMLAAVREAYRHGKQAAWLPGEDYIRLLSEPLEEARKRLNILRPARYESIPIALRSDALKNVQAAA